MHLSRPGWPLAALLLAWLLLGPPTAEAANAPVYWDGTISVHRITHGPACLTGVYDTNWTLRIRWREGLRLDVVDRQGVVVGQLVRLEDQGSTWRGEETGYFEYRTPGKFTQMTYSGSGSGMGRTISVGWIYYSLADDDPLAGVLPNGAYYFGGGSGTLAAFSTNIHTVITDRFGVDEHDTPFNNIAMLDYFAGRVWLGFGQAPRQPVTVDWLRRWLPGLVMENHDDQLRVMREGRMQGSYDRTKDWGRNLGMRRSLQHKVSWDLTRSLGVKAVMTLTPQDWRPSREEGKNQVDLKLEIQEPQGVEGRFEVTMFEVSREKGYCMNAGTGQEPDLEFPAGQEGWQDPTQEGDSWVLKGKDSLREATAAIRSLDYGAWARLKARVKVEGKWYDCITEDGFSETTVPVDEDEDHIADSWEKARGVSDQNAQADQDAQPDGVGDPNEPGDGYSNYEEYRGFEVMGQWADTDPKTKDLFIRDELGFGVGYFTVLGLALHLIDADEMDGQRVVNFNRDQEKTLPEQAGEGQKGLRVLEGHPDGALGRTSMVGCPNVVDRVEINLDEVWESYLFSLKYRQVEAYYWHSHQDRPSQAQGAPQGFMDQLNSTIAHELGHAVNMMHHAFSDPCPGGQLPDYDSIGMDEWDYVWIPNYTAVPGGLWSGDIGCLMIPYLPVNYYGSDGKYHLYPEELVTPAHDFCSGQAGTGVNSSNFTPPPGDDRPYPVAGSATWGNCRGMVDLKGKHYYGDVPELQ